MFDVIMYMGGGKCVVVIHGDKKYPNKRTMEFASKEDADDFVSNYLAKNKIENWKFETSANGYNTTHF